MREYYPVLFVINRNKHFCCWYGDEKDGFVVLHSQTRRFFYLSLDMRHCQSQKKLMIKEYWLQSRRNFFLSRRPYYCLEHLWVWQ